MSKFYLLATFMLSALSAYSQACLPDSTYRDSTAGVYPRPIVPGGTGKGIDKAACINKPYEFVFTVVIPDTLRIPGVPLLLNLTHAKIDPTGAISNLPDGITYGCNPPTCIYPKKTIGCLVLKGTPTKNNTPGDYKPVIKLTIGTLLGNIEIDYPGAQFPGEYILKLYDENCLIATKDIQVSQYSFFPNPTQGWINSREEEIREFRLTNSIGQLISYQPTLSESKFLLDEKLPDGFYLLQWKSTNKSYSQKILLQRN